MALAKVRIAGTGENLVDAAPEHHVAAQEQLCAASDGPFRSCGGVIRDLRHRSRISCVPTPAEPEGSQPICADRIARREINLFVDHSQIVQLEAHRSGIRGTKST